MWVSVLTSDHLCHKTDFCPVGDTIGGGHLSVYQLEVQQVSWTGTPPRSFRLGGKPIHELARQWAG